MERLIFLLGDSSCPAHFMIVVTFTSHPPTRSSLADKTAPSLCISPALYCHDTSSSFVSLSSTPSFFLTATGLSFICKYSCVIGRKKYFASYLKINIAHNLPGFPLLDQIRLLWLDAASEESDTCCLESRVKCREHREAADGKRGQDWLCMDGPSQGRESRKRHRGKYTLR